MKTTSWRIPLYTRKPIFVFTFLQVFFLFLSGCGESNVRSGGKEVAGGEEVVLESFDPRCSNCHGGAESPAPPKDLSGGEETSAVGVGAHQAHLNSGRYTDAVLCVDCHMVPAVVESKGHVDSSLPAELVFSDLAKSDGSSPVWNGTTCSDVYCHGSTLTGGTVSELSWTKVDGSQVFCGSCHGTPPPAPHPQEADCSGCHGEVVDGSGAIKNRLLHINGAIEVSGGGVCGSCHDLPPSTGEHRKGPHLKEDCSACHGSGYSTTTVRLESHDDGNKDVGGAGSEILSWNGSKCGPTCHDPEDW